MNLPEALSQGPSSDEDLNTADGLETIVSDGVSHVNTSHTRSNRRSSQLHGRDDMLIGSSYAISGAPSNLANFGTKQEGVPGVDPPRDVVRIERDWTSGDIAQFQTNFPLELEGRVTPVQFQNLINDINSILVNANSFSHAVFDNVLMVITMHLSLLFKTSHFEKEIGKLEDTLRSVNSEVLNPCGLHAKNPKSSAFMFLEIEYY